VETSEVTDFAKRYTAAWCSQNAGSVAAFFSDTGSLTINGSVPAVGREAITASAQSFMTAFPDLIVSMDALDRVDDHLVYRWTLAGTNNGPGGTGNAVRIQGYEHWTFGADKLIASSLGHFDQEEYQRQLTAGFGP